MIGPPQKGSMFIVMHGGLQNNGQAARQNSPDRPMTEAVVVNLPVTTAILPMVSTILPMVSTILPMVNVTAI